MCYLQSYAERTYTESAAGSYGRRGFLVDLTPHNSACASPCSAWPQTGTPPECVSVSTELVGCAEAPGLQRRRRHHAKLFELLGRIGTQVGFGAFQAGVAEPERDFPHVASRLKRMHGAGLPQHVWTDPLAGERGNGT